MLPGQLQAQYAADPFYQAYLQWQAAGGKHGSYEGLVPNEAVARVVNYDWGENKAFDAAGNEVSMYRPPRPGEISPYVGTGAAAPAYNPAASAAAPVPWAFTAKGIAGAPQPVHYG